MATNIPLELQSQLESKNAPLEGSLDCFRVVPVVNLSQTCVGSASFQQMPHPRQRAWSASSRTKSWRPPVCLQSSPETQRCCGHCFCSGSNRRGGAAAASDSFHKCSLTLHGCFWMPDKKQCWTCESYTDGQIFALDLQNVLLKIVSDWAAKASNFLTIWCFSLSPNWTVRTLMFCWSVGMT